MYQAPILSTYVHMLSARDSEEGKKSVFLPEVSTPSRFQFLFA